MQDEYQTDPKSGRKKVAHFLDSAIKAFAADAPGDYKRLVKEYDGRSAVVGLFGIGSASVTVRGGDVVVDGPPDNKTRLIARAATHPETILALAEGRTTAMEAFHVGDLVVRAPSDELHRAFGHMVQLSEPVLRSAKLQAVLKEFRAAVAGRTGAAA